MPTRKSVTQRKSVKRRSKKRGANAPSRLKLAGWDTTDEEERARRQQRGRDAIDMTITSLEKSLAPFGHYHIESGERQYRVEVRSFNESVNSCNCIDFRVNRLGTCKHIEAVLHRKHRQRNRRPERRVSEIFLDSSVSPSELRWRDLGTWQGDSIPTGLAVLQGHPRYSARLVSNLQAKLDELTPSRKRRWRISPILLERCAAENEDARVSRRVSKMLATSGTGTSRKQAKRKAARSDPGIKLPLYPYQREGMRHLVSCQRAILADEMGLGKTVQGIAACALLQQLGLAERVLVVSPASLKSEWEEQIGIFTEHQSQVVVGNRRARLDIYGNPRFFTLVNYEQVLRDSADINALLKPDIVVLDEAQRIKNWQTRTADSIKRLSSRYAFVLTGTPIENRIDEIYSIMQFVNPEVLGPLFRFNREYYVLNERGNPVGYKQLDKLNETVKPWLLRRTKDEVEGDLPPCTTRTILTEMSAEQTLRYAEDEAVVARIAASAKHRALSPDEMKRLQIKLANMRMYCDSVYIRDPKVTESPKLDELDALLDELLAGTHKILVFSEWTGMLDLLRMRLDRRDVGYALHTGKVPQHKRRIEINRFKQDEQCRLFLSTESGGAGLNLQVADVVINLDLPWNPAKLAQRIARAWRKNQTRSVQVINLVAKDTIEHRMIARLEAKQRMSDAVLSGGLDAMALPSGRSAMLQQIEDLMAWPSGGKQSTLDTAEGVDTTPGTGTGNSGSSARSPGTDKAAASSSASTHDKTTLNRVSPLTSWNDLASQVAERYYPVVQQLEIQKLDGRHVVIATTVGNKEELGEFLDSLAGPDGKPLTVQIMSPTERKQLDTLLAMGIVKLAGSAEILLAKGRICEGESVKELIQRELNPHLESANAALLLESNGFAQQARSLLDVLIPKLAQSMDKLRLAGVSERDTNMDEVSETGAPHAARKLVDRLQRVLRSSQFPNTSK